MNGTTTQDRNADCTIVALPPIRIVAPLSLPTCNAFGISLMQCMQRVQFSLSTVISFLSYWDKMPEMSKKNYGQWQYHEYLKPGVMKHVGPAGALYTVRVGSPRLLSIETLRWFADIADILR